MQKPVHYRNYSFWLRKTEFHESHWMPQKCLFLNRVTKDFSNNNKLDSQGEGGDTTQVLQQASCSFVTVYKLDLSSLTHFHPRIQEQINKYTTKSEG